jgi:HEAT repeat protein
MVPRVSRLALLGLLLSAAAARPDDEVKPAAGEVEAAREELGKTGLAGFHQRYDALDVAGRSDDPSLVPLLFLAALQAKSPSFAVAAGEAANRLDPKAAVRAYASHKGKARKHEAAQAVRFLGEIRSKEAARRLVEAAGSKDTERRVEALYGLVKQNDPVLWPHLVSALKSKKYEIKVPGAICCGLVRASGANDLLLRGLDDTKNDYAYFCAWALGQMRDPKILGRVVAATKGRMSGEVGTAKAKAIIECALPEDKHVDILIGLARASDEAIAGAAAGALGRVGGSHPEAADALLALVVRSGTPTLSSLAADALARIGGPEHGAKILARHKANPGNVPAHAIKALGLLKTVGADGLLLQVANRSRSHALRKRAAIAFWQCADRAARDKFRQRLEAATQEKVVAAGCLVLGFHRAEEGFQFAVQLLRRHYGKKKVVRHVRAALERMTGHRFATEPNIWKNWFKESPDFFVRKPQFLDREAWRKQLVENKVQMGISKKTEAAVERGLAWLARHQELDGRWSGDRFTDRCKRYFRKKCQVGARLGDWDVGMTGIALLAFYGAGYRPTGGRHKDTVLRAQVYTAARQWADGDFGGQGDLIGGYTRPIATIALAEAYGTTRDEEYRERTRRSAAHLIRIQYADAGWRYRLSGQAPGDTSVTGWNAWAIATARKVGVPVDPMGLEGANSLIDSFSSRVKEDEEFYNHDPRYYFDVGRGQSFEHFTGYNAREETRPPMTAIGLICKIFMGRQRSHPYCIGAANRLLRSIPEYDERGNKIKYTAGAEYPSYYWYYGSLAMYQMGGRFWRRWSRPLLTEGVPNTQVRGEECEDGSWHSHNLDSIGGRVYTTSMCVLTLETFYRYLPALRME